jgi:hypothetical protein
MKHDLPNDWQMLKKTGSIDLKIDKYRLPYMIQVIDKPAIEEVMFLAQVKDGPGSYSINIDETAIDLAKISNEVNLCRGKTEDIKIDKAFSLSIAADQLEKLDELVFVIKYAIPKF